MTMTERQPKPKGEEEVPAARTVVFLRDTEKWIRDSVFMNMPSAERERCMRNLTNALAQDKPALLYGGVKDDMIRSKLGILFSMLSETRTPGIYGMNLGQKNEFFARIDAYQETAKGREALMLTPKTEDWLKTHVFWGSKKEGLELYLRNLNTALRERDPSLLYADIGPQDLMARTTLGRLYNVLTSAKPKGGTYSITDSKKDEFFAMQEDFIKTMEARKAKQRPEPERAVVKREEKTPVAEEEKPSAPKLRARPAPVAARVQFEEEKESEGARSIFKIETAAGKPPTTFYIEAPKLSDDEMRRFRAMFNADHAEALASVAKMPDVKLYVAHGEEWREVEQKEMLAMLRQESERLRRVTHTAGESAIGSA